MAALYPADSGLLTMGAKLMWAIANDRDHNTSSWGGLGLVQHTLQGLRRGVVDQAKRTSLGALQG